MGQGVWRGKLKLRNQVIERFILLVEIFGYYLFHFSGPRSIQWRGAKIIKQVCGNGTHILDVKIMNMLLPLPLLIIFAMLQIAVPMSMNTIFEEVMKNEAGRSFTLDRIRASLIELGCPSDIDETYSIGMIGFLYIHFLWPCSLPIHLILISTSHFSFSIFFYFCVLNWHTSADLKKIIELAQNEEVCFISLLSIVVRSYSLMYSSIQIL